MRDAERAAHVAAAQAQQRFAAKLRTIARQANTSRSTGFSVPILDDDPGSDFPGNAWLLDDGGRLRTRGTDGTVYDYPSGMQILSLSAAPAASSGIDLYRDSGSDELRVRRPNGTWAAYPSITAAASGDSATRGSHTRKTKQPDPTPTKHRQTWGATWARIFCARHGVETGGDLHYGTYDSTHGQRRIMVGFNDAAIRSALAGGSIKAVELSMLNTDSWSHAGIDVHFGAHNRSAAPGSYSAVRANAYVGHWPEVGGAAWRSVSTWFGTALRDGSIRGLTIDQPGGVQYYGEMRWSSVQLRITWVG